MGVALFCGRHGGSWVSLVEWVFSGTRTKGAPPGCGDVIPVPNGSPTGAWLLEAAIDRVGAAMRRVPGG